jgi:hypothetical protein
MAPMTRAIPIIPPNTLPTITPTRAVGEDDEDDEDDEDNEGDEDGDVVVDIEEEEGEEEAV